MIRYFTVIKKGIATSEMQMRSYNIPTSRLFIYAKYAYCMQSIVPHVAPLF